MKLATTTGDFYPYTKSQTEAMEYIRRAGFKYIDYNFGTDYNCKNGIYGDDPQKHIEDVLKKAEELGVKDKDIVSVKADSEERSCIFGDVVVRVSEKFALAMHIDTDEANAAFGVKEGYIVK